MRCPSPGSGRVADRVSRAQHVALLISLFFRGDLVILDPAPVVGHELLLPSEFAAVSDEPWCLPSIEFRIESHRAGCGSRPSSRQWRPCVAELRWKLHSQGQSGVIKLSEWVAVWCRLGMICGPHQGHASRRRCDVKSSPDSAASRSTGSAMATSVSGSRSCWLLVFPRRLFAKRSLRFVSV